MRQQRKHLARHGARSTAGRRHSGKKQENSTVWTRGVLHQRSATSAAYRQSLKQKSLVKGRNTTGSERRSSHPSSGTPDSEYRNHIQAGASATSKNEVFFQSTGRYPCMRDMDRYESEIQGESRRFDVQSRSVDWRLIP
jgi:hypothetical protein